MRLKRKILTIKEYEGILDLLANEPEITVAEIAKIFGVSTDTIYNANKGRLKIVRELWDGGFPIRPLGKKRTEAIMHDLRDGMEVEEVIEKWGIRKEYANTLKRRVKKENEA